MGGYTDTDIRNKIWEGDRLERRREADTIEKYIVNEVKFFERLDREDSIVLGIDAPYGRGKSWFLERLAKQLELSHPVARIDAWADDAGDEPLTAFMAAIDDALAIYLSNSKQLGDRMAAAKASALPVIGKLLTGAGIKALSKLAGDEIQDHLGNVIEEAVNGAKDNKHDKNDGAAAAAMEEAFNKLGEEIDSLVDRRGAAMLASYRIRKKSRSVFKRKMRELVAQIDLSDGPGCAPLIVIVDELDRCRPNYALRVLEEIKHFFEVPGVVFILGLHGDQLSKSVRAVYGAEFDSDDYLRRFFTRRYELRPYQIGELVASVFEEWKIDENRFRYPTPTISNTYALTNPRFFGLVLSEWSTTPREVFAIMDGVRLFVDGWEHPDPIEPIALMSLLVQLVRGQSLNFVHNGEVGSLHFEGTSWDPGNGNGKPKSFTVKSYLSTLNPLAWRPLQEINGQRVGRDPAQNYLVEWLKAEWNARCARSPNNRPNQSHLADYIPRISDLARFIDRPKRENGEDD